MGHRKVGAESTFVGVGLGFELLGVLRNQLPQVFDAEPPSTLYHYTSADGMQAILESSHLVATNLRFMNDRTELDYGVQLASKIIGREQEKHGPKSMEHSILRKCTDMLAFFDVEARDIPIADFYGTCFCESDDSLGQWRAYARDGSGYALGFAGEQLKQSPFQGQGVLLKVTYDLQEQERSMAALVDAFLGFLREKWPTLHGSEKTALRRQAAISFNTAVAFLVVSFKHPSFAAEREWRYVQLIRDSEISSLTFRPRSGTLVPSTSLVLRNERKFPLVEVVHGPGAQQQTSLLGLRLFVRKSGLDSLVIRRSTVPMSQHV